MALTMMSDFAEAFVTAVLTRAWDRAFQSLSLLQSSEIFRVLAVLDRKDLAELACQAANATDDLDGALPFLACAIQTVKTGKLAPRVHAPKLPPPDPRLQSFKKKLAAFELAGVSYIHEVVRLHKTPIGFSSDLTGTLPVEVSHPPLLSEADYTSAAKTLGVEIEVIKAVSQVESGRNGFEDGHRPTIRYELHVFNKATQSEYLQTHPWLAQLHWNDGKKYHNHGQAGEYSMMYNAMILGGVRRRIDEGITSASWGRFQVMGFNFQSVGWTSATTFANDMYLTEANHLKAFIGYIQANNLAKALQNKDWTAFASGYNGSGQVASYSSRLQNAYDALVALRPKPKPQPQVEHVPTK